MDINWQIVAAAAGFAGGRALLDEYRMWKARRASIPLDWNPKTQTYEPDFKLKRLERIGTYLIWGVAGAFSALGIMAIMYADI